MPAVHLDSRMPVSPHRRRLAGGRMTSALVVAVSAVAMSLAMSSVGVAGAVATSGSQAALTAHPAESHVPPPTGILTFTGHGWGHGIGMSQWGAYGAAEQGLSATDILNFYYPNTSPVRIDPHTPIRVLLGTDDGVQVVVSPVAANGALSFTDVATGKVTALPTAVGGAAVTAWRAVLVGSTVQLQGKWNNVFQAYPASAPISVSGTARFTSSSGVVRLLNPSGTQVDLRGSVDGVRIGSALRTVEQVGLDDMLPGVLGKEMSATWPTAALQAQAVAARSYADFQINAHVGQPYDIAIPHDVAYEGVARYDANGTKVASWDDPRLVAAVNAYPGDVRTYGGKVIFAMFSSSDGGYTVAGLVSGSHVPYLIAQPDPYDAVAQNSHHTWTANVPVTTVSAAYGIGSLTSIVVNSRDGNGEWGGRVLSVTVNGSTGSATDSGTGFAAKLGLQDEWWQLPDSGDPIGLLESAVTAPGGAHISGYAYDPKTTAAILVHVYVDGKLLTAVPANVDRPDLAAQLPSGTAHGFAANLALTPGAHTVCAYAINSVPPGPNPKLGCADVQAYASGPIGTASVTSGIGGVAISGWTLDPGTVKPLTLQIKVDGVTKSTVAADKPDDTVAAQFPFYGAGHGFDLLLNVAGTHDVCVSTGSVTLKCARVTVYVGSPLGYLDAVLPQPGSVALWGWAIDPDTSASLPVHIYVDGQLTTGLAATESRPDVEAVFPAYGVSHGYSAIVPLAAGRHTVCAWALNIAATGSNRELGCKTVTVPSGDPVGHLDGVAYEGQVVAWGWAADPKAPTSPVLVHIYVDGTLTTLGPAILARPDVARVFPSFGPAHGFFVAVPAKSGDHRVCAFAINLRAGDNNPSIGCANVKVP